MDSLLVKLPVELLSHICDETEQDSLISLARTCKFFNELAGHRYLRLLKFDLRTDHLSILNEDMLYYYRLGAPGSKDTVDAFDFKTVCGIAGVLGALSNITALTCSFSRSEIETLRQMGHLVQILRAIPFRKLQTRILFPSYSQFSLRLKFRCNSLHQGAATSTHLGEMFQAMLHELQRLQCDCFQIGGVLPSLQNAATLNLPVGRFLNILEISKSLILPPYHCWLIELLNSSPNLCNIDAQCSKEWVDILPHLRVSGLRSMSFSGTIGHAQASDVKVLINFVKRHRRLSTLICGEQFTATSSSRRCMERLPRIVTLGGTISILHYFLSSPDTTLCNLQDVGVCRATNPGKYSLWELFALICTRSSITKITFPINLGESPAQLFSGSRYKLRSSVITRSKFPHVHCLGLEEAHTLPTDLIDNFLAWAQRVFPSVEQLELSGSRWTQLEPLVMSVRKAWPTVREVLIDGCTVYRAQGPHYFLYF